MPLHTAPITVIASRDWLGLTRGATSGGRQETEAPRREIGCGALGHTRGLAEPGPISAHTF